MAGNPKLMSQIKHLLQLHLRGNRINGSTTIFEETRLPTKGSGRGSLVLKDVMAPSSFFP